MSRWTAQQIAQLATDDRSVAAARKLARPGPWSDTGCTDVLVWGRCQGSGSTPYQVTVDLTGPAFKCSCPSRKFPCKHGLALLMLWVAGDGSVADVDAPADFAGAWAGPRAARAAGRSASGATDGADVKPVDPVAQAKRREERVALMSAGMADFELWLADLVRQGLAAARQQSYGFWDAAAARLVDAQLPGLAERVRDAATLVVADDDWVDTLLAETGRWWSAARAWSRRDELDGDDLANLRTFVGWSYTTEEIRAAATVTDRWQVLGVHRTDDGRLQQQRTWLGGLATGEVVLVLDFAMVGGALGVAKVVGSIIDEPLGIYPGTAPRRARFGDDPRVSGTASDLPAPSTIEAGLDDIARRMGDNPWIDRFPLTIADARLALPESGDGPSYVVDGTGASLPLVASLLPWPLLAHTGGQGVDVFGEVDAGAFRPLTIARTGELVGL